MTGNLSHQIEHHLFPDLPQQPVRRDRPAGAGRSSSVRPDLHTGSLPKQVASAWHKVVRLSLPNGFEKAPLATVTALTTKTGSPRTAEAPGSLRSQPSGCAQQDLTGSVGVPPPQVPAGAGVLALVVDRVADYVAEQAAAGELQRSQGLESKPDVSITGFPFLNQFASGHYEQVIVTADDVRVGAADASLTLAKVRLDFRGVTASRDFTSFRAQTATAHATVGYPRSARH